MIKYLLRKHEDLSLSQAWWHTRVITVLGKETRKPPRLLIHPAEANQQTLDPSKRACGNSRDETSKVDLWSPHPCAQTWVYQHKHRDTDTKRKLPVPGQSSHSIQLLQHCEGPQTSLKNTVPTRPPPTHTHGQKNDGIRKICLSHTLVE